MKTQDKCARETELRDFRIGIVGLGYVGLPLALLFSSKYPTIGFDINRVRVDELNSGYDSLLEVSEDSLSKALSNHGFKCSSQLEDLKDCNFYIVTVPTPIDDDSMPDLQPLLSASELIGKVISKGDIVVFESTVYPGVTEEKCIPVIEKSSGLKLNEDFFAGYSPERVNVGDKLHRIENIRKVTSGSTPEIADIIDRIYDSVLANGTYKASSIRVAEASKVIENAQRDLNIAFFNELARILNALGLDTQEVIDAASSKWNFVRMKPGLVGGHCIAVDPYYLIEKAKENDIMPNLLIAAREVNEGMSAYVAGKTIDIMNKKGIPVKDSDILILGVTFKENCPDVRNTKIVDIYRHLKGYTENVTVLDHWADPEIVSKELGFELSTEPLESLEGRFDAVILAVAHEQFRDSDIRRLLKDPEKGVVYDVKSVLPMDMIDGRL